MRFAFMPILAAETPAWSDILDLWRAADDIEVFESGWMFDHFSAASVNANGPCFEAWTTISALSLATSRLRIGTMVLAAARRHPALLAQMALTLDTISCGRIELGLGAGSRVADHISHGIDLGSPLIRTERLDAVCGLLVQLLSGHVVTSRDQDRAPVEAMCDIPPVQQPHLPICIGGAGERRTLRIAAQWGQHWNYLGRDPEDFARKRRLLGTYCAEIGRDPSGIITSASVRDDSSAEQVAERAAAFAAGGADLVVVQVPPPYRPRRLERLAAVLDPLR